MIRGPYFVELASLVPMKFFRPLIVVIVLSGCGTLPTYGALEVTGRDTLPEAGTQISVTTWNVGYGAMGAEADFVADGGKHMRALDADAIALAVVEIGREVDRFDAQFLLFQELANGSFLSRNVSVQAEVERALPDYSSVYWEEPWGDCTQALRHFTRDGRLCPNGHAHYPRL